VTGLQNQAQIIGVKESPTMQQRKNKKEGPTGQQRRKEKKKIDDPIG
jgi:hypothetical protein